MKDLVAKRAASSSHQKEARGVAVATGPTPDTVRAASGKLLTIPDGWTLLPPGDATLTRRVKAACDHWIVQEKKGRRTYSKGVWAPGATISRIRAELESERSSEAYAARRAADARRRDKVQTDYINDFSTAVLAYLGFHRKHAAVAETLARAVAEHATPIGSGTVARTKRISIERRAEAAVIAWMRHHTTAYDRMTIPRAKGKRREVRRMLAGRSKELLVRYRRGETAATDCPLRQAVVNISPLSAGQDTILKPSANGSRTEAKREDAKVSQSPRDQR